MSRMRRSWWRLAVLPLVAVVPVNDEAPPVGDTAGPVVQARPERAEPGERIDVSVSGFTSLSVTAAFCGNNALRGSGDCNMAASEGNETDAANLVSRFTMVVSEPPTDCPCVLWVLGANQAEMALVPFEVIGHPIGPLVKPPTLAGLIDATVKAVEDPAGPMAAAVASLGGDTTYAITLQVRNRSAETLSAASARGTARDADGNAVVSFDLGTSPPIAPGQTWTSTAQARIPAPTLGEMQWEVDVVGVGPSLQATTTTVHRPLLLIVVLCMAVICLSMFVARRLIRRHAARSEAAVAEAPVDAAGVEQLEPVS